MVLEDGEEATLSGVLMDQEAELGNLFPWYKVGQKKSKWQVNTCT